MVVAVRSDPTAGTGSADGPGRRATRRVGAGVRRARAFAGRVPREPRRGRFRLVRRHRGGQGAVRDPAACGPTMGRADATRVRLGARGGRGIRDVPVGSAGVAHRTRRTLRIQPSELLPSATRGARPRRSSTSSSGPGTPAIARDEARRVEASTAGGDVVQPGSVRGGSAGSGMLTQLGDVDHRLGHMHDDPGSGDGSSSHAVARLGFFSFGSDLSITSNR